MTITDSPTAPSSSKSNGGNSPSTSTTSRSVGGIEPAGRPDSASGSAGSTGTLWVGASVRAAAARLVGGVGFLAGAFDVGAFDTRAFDPGAFLAGVLRADGAGRSGPPDGAEPVSASSSGRNWRVSPPSAALDSEPAFGSLGAAPGCAVPSLSTAPGCAVPSLSVT